MNRFLHLLLILAMFFPLPVDIRTYPAFPVERWLVEFDTPALATAQPGRTPGLAVVAAPERLNLTTEASQRYLAALSNEHSRFLTGNHLIAQRRYGIVFNGVAVNVTQDRADQIRRLPGVRGVWRDVPFHVHEDPSVEQMKLDVVWRQVGGASMAGKGVKIAIIDSGIYPHNPSFNPEGFEMPAGYPKGDVSATSAKIIAARAYFRPDQPPIRGDESPVPGVRSSGHGTHVASLAAGNAGVLATVSGVETQISGAAPGAYLMNYRVFYPSTSTIDVFSAAAFSTELVAAIEDAVADGADIINNSWGSPQSQYSWHEPITRAAQAAAAAGVVVVFSAGNEGPAPGTLSARAVPDEVISVGAVSTGAEIAAGSVRVIDGPPSISSLAATRGGFGARPDGPTLGKGTVTYPLGAGSACAALDRTEVSGSIVMVGRGGCTFVQKATNVQEAGGVGVVFVSDTDERLTASGDETASQVRIPIVMIGKTEGQQLAKWIADHPKTELAVDTSIGLASVVPDRLARYSSRGPAGGGALKPDLVAPGSNIIGAGFGTGTEPLKGFGQISGTSMAAPRVAGASAILRQIYPRWTAADIRAALMVTADRNVLGPDGQSAGTFERGAGRLNLLRAISPPFLAQPPSIGFGTMVAGVTAERSIHFTATDGGEYLFSVEQKERDGAPLNVTFTVEPSSANLRRDQSISLRVTVHSSVGSVPGLYSSDVLVKSPFATGSIPVGARVSSSLTNRVLILDNDGSNESTRRSAIETYTNALDASDVKYDIMDIDSLSPREATGGVLPPVWFLEQYPVVLWITGDRDNPGLPARLTQYDQNVISDYLLEGGNLIAFGRRFIEATDVNPRSDPTFGRARLVSDHFGAMSRRRTPMPDSATGHSSSPLSGKVIRFNGNGDVPVIEPYSYRPFYDGEVLMETSKVLLDSSNGAIAIYNVSNPTIADDRIWFPFRTALLGFDLQDVAVSDRSDLLLSLLNWARERR